MYKFVDWGSGENQLTIDKSLIKNHYSSITILYFLSLFYNSIIFPMAQQSLIGESNL